MITPSRNPLARKPLNRVGIFVILMVMLLGLITQTVFAQQTIPSDNEVNAVAKQMYCPVCENIPLDVCPTQACAQWRELIRLKLSEGWSEKQIKDYFVAQYGDRVLAEPPRTGLNWLVYILPPAIFLVGAGIVYRVFSTMRRTKSSFPTSAAMEKKEDDLYLAKLEEELRRRQKGNS